MIPGTRVIHAEKENLSGVVREYQDRHQFQTGDSPGVFVEWGAGGSKGESWVPIASVVAIEMEEAVKDREWFSCIVEGGEAQIRLGVIEYVGPVIQAEVHTVAIPERQAQIQIVIQEPITRAVAGTDPAETSPDLVTVEWHAPFGTPETEPDLNVTPPPFDKVGGPLGDPED